MTWMIMGHLINWWVRTEYSWLYSITSMIIDPIGASGFLFISGVSITISLRGRLNRAKELEDYNYRMVRNSYLFRGLFLFITAIIYNIPIAISLGDPSMIWTWFVLLTVSVSLLLAWPLLKTHKLFRIFIAIAILVIHFSIIPWLLPFQGEANFFGLLFHVLYNIIFLDPILIFFPFFIIGTVIGDLIYETIYTNKDDKQNLSFKKKLLIPTILIGILMIILGIFLNFPQFLFRVSLSWVIYSIGIDLLILSVLLAIEQFNIYSPKRSYKLIFYYSYYSLTIFLAHNLLYFLFLYQLDLVSIWFSIIISFFSIGFLLRVVFKKFKEKASIKIQIGRLSEKVSRSIEVRINKRNKKP
jgi:hypothetical protein